MWQKNMAGYQMHDEYRDYKKVASTVDIICSISFHILYLSFIIIIYY